MTTGLQWERMTVGDLRQMLDGLVREGDVTDETLIVVDSDPEGNQLNPMRQAYALGTLQFGPGGRIEDFVDDPALPAATMWLGVGY